MYKTTNRFQTTFAHRPRLSESRIRTATDECRELATDLIIYETYLKELSRVAAEAATAAGIKTNQRKTLEKVARMGNFRPQGYLVLKMSRRASEDECGRFVNAAHAEFKKFALSVISANRSVRDLHLDRLVPESHKQLKVFTHRLITEKAKDGRYEAAREWLSNLGLGIYT